MQDLSGWTIGDLEPHLAEALLGGAEFLSSFLQQLANDPSLPMPPALTCNICDRQIQPWFFEKHTGLCIVSHKAESEVQDCHDHLRDHRQVISGVLLAFENDSMIPSYKNFEIDLQLEFQPSISSSPTVDRSKSDEHRRSFIRTVELILDYCDLAIDISTPAIPEDDGVDVFGRIQSPDSRNRISQLHEWNRPNIEHEAIKALYEDTNSLVNAKLSAITRLHNTIHYSEKIRQEIGSSVQDLIDQTTLDAGEDMLDDGTAESEMAEPSTAYIPPTHDPNRIAFDASFREATASPCLSTTSDISPGMKGPSIELEVSPFNNLSLESNSATSSTSSPAKNIVSISESTHDHEPRASSPLSQFPPFSQTEQSIRGHSSLSAALQRPNSSAGSSETGMSNEFSRRNSPQDIEFQTREVRASRGIYDSPRRPSGGSRPPTGFSPSRRGSRAVSRNRATSLARDRGLSPGRKSLSSRLGLLDRERLSPAGSPTLSASETMSTSTETSLRDRRVSMLPPLSPRLPSIAPAARPAPPSIKDFDIIKPISKGAFGSVYLSKKRTTGDYYAIKVLKKADMIAKNQVTNIKAERAIMMAQMESPFIARLYFTFQSKEYLYLVMEYLNGGDCAALIKQLGGLPEDWTKRYMSEVVLGLEYLHSRGIIHRDLKPDNLLISHNGHLKLTDFGLSRVGLVGRQNRARTSSHPEVPDLLQHNTISNRSGSPSSSRSASFDFAQSGLSTPAIAPVTVNEARSGYFTLRERKPSQGDTPESSRYETDTFSSAMSKLNLDETKYDSDEGSTASGRSSCSPLPGRITPDTRPKSPSTPSSAAQMPPPAMRLFDPRESNKKFVGTPDYLAPETINGSGQDDMVDWWSLGVILFEFIYGYPPFHAESPDAVFQNILARHINWPSEQEEVDLNISQTAKDLMNALMTLRPDERLGCQNGAADIKAHLFFSGVAWESISEEEALFVPTPDNPEDTDYFDARGATDHVFEDDSDTPNSVDGSNSTSEKEARPVVVRDASFSNRMVAQSKQIVKRTMMPLSIPPHVRDRHRNRRASESGKDEFGSFTFKNLGVLEKQNLDAIKRLRSEQSLVSPVTIPQNNHMAHHSRSASSSSSVHMHRPSSSSTSTSASTPISPPNLSGLGIHRNSLPASPLVTSTSGPSQSPRHRSQGSLSTPSAAGSSGRNSINRLYEMPDTPTRSSVQSKSLPLSALSPRSPKSPRNRSFTVGSDARPELPFNWGSVRSLSRVFEPDTPSSSSDGESATGVKALQRVQKRRQRSKRLSSVSMPPARAHRPLDILICEDNPVSRRVLEAMLGKLKCHVVSVVDGAQAVAAATGDVVFDVIFTDIKVPRLSGVEVARLVRSSPGSNTETPIVAMSSYSTADFKEMAQFFQKRLEKPLTIKAISQTIEELIPDWQAPAPSVKGTKTSGNVG